MEENSLVLKGKNGAYFEHFFWIAFYYLFYVSGMQMNFYVKGNTIIDSCDFKSSIWSDIKSEYIPIVIWIMFGIGEYIGYIANKK